VDRHPYPRRPAFLAESRLQVALRRERRRHRAGGARERRAEGISDGLEHVSSMGVDGGPHDRVVAGEGCLHGHGVPLPLARASLDVREEKGDGSARQLRHAHIPYGAIWLVP
jgi:hypothetical protein